MGACVFELLCERLVIRVFALDFACEMLFVGGFIFDFSFVNVIDEGV